MHYLFACVELDDILMDSWSKVDSYLIGIGFTKALWGVDKDGSASVSKLPTNLFVTSSTATLTARLLRDRITEEFLRMFPKDGWNLVVISSDTWSTEETHYKIRVRDGIKEDVESLEIDRE